MKSEPFIFNGKTYISVSFTAQEIDLVNSLANIKENFNMTTKNFSVIDNGASVDPRYTIKYHVPDPCRVTLVHTSEYKDLINLSVDELNILRTKIDNLGANDKSDSIEDFAKDFKKLCNKY